MVSILQVFLVSYKNFIFNGNNNTIFYKKIPD